ncbi:MAG: nucleoside kinase [Anaerovoracaceae bacterium]|jgi:uridine kinase
MKIRLKTDPRGDFEEIDIKRGTSIEKLYQDRAETLPYTVLSAKVNNKYEGLRYSLTEECSVELLDMRNQEAAYVYQHSLSLIYIAACRQVLGDVRVEIENSLNQGLYTEIKGAGVLDAEQVGKIEDRMRVLVDEDLPIVKEYMDRDKGIRELQRQGEEEKVRLVEMNPRLTNLKFYGLDNTKTMSYSLMAPSTGYVQYFELMKYRRGVLVRFPKPEEPDKIPPFDDEAELYKAFGEQTIWDRLLGVSYVSDLNEKIANGEYLDLIQLSEALHEKKVAEIADRIKQEKKRIVLIAGPSSSGKTTFARRLCIQLRVIGLHPLYLGTDDYFVDRKDTPLDENGEPNYEGLDAIDIDLFNQNMNDLLAGKTVDLPTFDFLSGEKHFGKRITSVRPNQPIVIEGIHGLNEELTKSIPHEEKFKIYISPLTQTNIDEYNRIPSTDERMLRRLVRDSQFRGHDAKMTINEWPKVRAGEDKNIFPYSGEADVLFNSYHDYEIPVLKKYAEPLLQKIGPDEPEYAEAVRMLGFLDYFDEYDDDDVIVNNSIIREFIGGSIFMR